MKKLAIGAAIGAAVLLVAAVAALVYFRSSPPDYGRSATLAGLGAPVEVWRDSLGVPHVWARDEADLAMALGYVHAQERLWQMEFFRRVADGRLSEILGSETIDSDRFLRTLGMGRAAAATEATLDPHHRALLQAYADGVNAWIADRRGALPPEFVALRFEPEPWTIRNTLSIGRLMAWDLADWEIGLELQRAVDLVGPEHAAELFPSYPDWGPRIVEDREPGLAGSGDRPRRALARLDLPLPFIPQQTAELLAAASISGASNSWVVDGDRTRSGAPILANDPHLALRAPSLWMIAALHGGDIAAAGVTIPGFPGVVIGRTPHVAWGFTNAGVDDVDFFVERLHPEDPRLYRTPDGWAELEIREDTIRVKGAEPVVHTVRSTRHGPIISDVDRRAGDRVLAIRWTGLSPSDEYVTFFALNRARGTEDVLAALRHFGNPHQNVVFADTSGRIGYRMGGTVPVRRSGDGVLPVPGWTGEYDWIGRLDPEEHPSLIDPAEGFIVTANNPPAGRGYPHAIGANPAEPFRAMRALELVADARDLTVEAVAGQQVDVRDAFAVRYLPRAIAAAREAGQDSAAELLGGWDARATPDSRAAALFYVWYEELRRAVAEDEYEGVRIYFPRSAMNRILDSGEGVWVDDVRTAARETLPELAAGAMRRAVALVEGRTWGDLHATHVRHALGTVRVLDRWLDLNVGPVVRGGSPYTLDVAGYGWGPPFVNTHGASMRVVADLGDADGAGWFIVPTGQSGVPFSRHYRDQTRMWREGRLWRVPLARSAAEPLAVGRMELRPR